MTVTPTWIPWGPLSEILEILQNSRGVGGVMVQNKEQPGEPLTKCSHHENTGLQGIDRTSGSDAEQHSAWELGSACLDRSVSDASAHSFLFLFVFCFSNVKKRASGRAARSGMVCEWPSWTADPLYAWLSCGLWREIWRPQTYPPFPGWSACSRWSPGTWCLWKRRRIPRAQQHLGRRGTLTIMQRRQMNMSSIV